MRIGALIAVVLLASALSVRAAEPAGKVVCFGDSITKAGYPRVLGEILKTEVINAGVGGHTSAMGLKRMAKDVLEHKPAVVVILFGTNDTRLDAPGVHVPVAKYEQNLAEMIRQCDAIGAKVVLCTIPPINPEPYFKRHVKEKFDAAGGLEKVLETYRAASRQVAQKHKVTLVDLAEILKKRPEWLSADGVHPTKEGTTILAEEIARGVKAVPGPQRVP